MTSRFRFGTVPSATFTEVCNLQMTDDLPIVRKGTSHLWDRVPMQFRDSSGVRLENAAAAYSIRSNTPASALR